MKEMKAYRQVIEHRKKCAKWGKLFCLDCFGGGLTLYTKKILKEFKRK